MPMAPPRRAPSVATMPWKRPRSNIWRRIGNRPRPADAIDSAFGALSDTCVAEVRVGDRFHRDAGGGPHRGMADGDPATATRHMIIQTRSAQPTRAMVTRAAQTPERGTEPPIAPAPAPPRSTTAEVKVNRLWEPRNEGKTA